MTKKVRLWVLFIVMSILVTSLFYMLRYADDPHNELLVHSHSVESQGYRPVHERDRTLLRDYVKTRLAQSDQSKARSEGDSLVEAANVGTKNTEEESMRPDDSGNALMSSFERFQVPQTPPRVSVVGILRSDDHAPLPVEASVPEVQVIRAAVGIIVDTTLPHALNNDSLVPHSTRAPGEPSLVRDDKGTIIKQNSEQNLYRQIDITQRRLALRPTANIPQRTTKSSPGKECPADHVIDGPDAEWFRSSIAQRSPAWNRTDSRDNWPEVLILTPTANAERHLWKYFKNLCSLDYPHSKISVVLGEDSSTDGTVIVAEKLAANVRPFFRRVEVIRLKSTGGAMSGNARHASFQQLMRRRHLAKSRNQLLFQGLGDEPWILWMDSDVKHIPTDLVQRLLATGKDIVAPNCLYRRDDGQTDTFDRNTWRDTEASKKHLDLVDSEFLMLEGYEPSKRKFLNDLKGEGDVVKIDGVGGCVLLVNADLHRNGLVFPTFTFEHHIETEGLAKMAAKMNIEMYGLPSVNVIHS